MSIVLTPKVRNVFSWTFLIIQIFFMLKWIEFQLMIDQKITMTVFVWFDVVCIRHYEHWALSWKTALRLQMINCQKSAMANLMQLEDNLLSFMHSEPPQSYEIKLPSQAFLDRRSSPWRKLRQFGCYDVAKFRFVNSRQLWI